MKQRGASRLNRAPENQSRNGHVTSQDMAPPIPERSYSVAKPVQPQSSSRPLPRRPDEAYHRLLQNQVYPSLIAFLILHVRKFKQDFLVIATTTKDDDFFPKKSYKNCVI